MFEWHFFFGSTDTLGVCRFYFFVNHCCAINSIFCLVLNLCHLWLYIYTNAWIFECCNSGFLKVEYKTCVLLVNVCHLRFYINIWILEGRYSGLWKNLNFLQFSCLFCQLSSFLVLSLHCFRLFFCLQITQHLFRCRFGTYTHPGRREPRTVRFTKQKKKPKACRFRRVHFRIGHSSVRNPALRLRIMRVLYWIIIDRGAVSS